MFGYHIFSIFQQEPQGTDYLHQLIVFSDAELH